MVAIRGLCEWHPKGVSPETARGTACGAHLGHKCVLVDSNPKHVQMAVVINVALVWHSGSAVSLNALCAEPLWLAFDFPP